MILKLSVDLKNESKHPGAAVMYDELYRQRMANRVCTKASGFSQNTVVLEIDRTLLEQAQQVFKERAPSQHQWSVHAKTQTQWGGHAKTWPSKGQSGDSGGGFQGGKNLPWNKRKYDGGHKDWGKKAKASGARSANPRIHF